MERRARIFYFTYAQVMASFALADPAEIETQHHVTGIPQRSRRSIDHFVVHGAAEQGMGVAD